jgi:hypothetical protein
MAERSRIRVKELQGEKEIDRISKPGLHYCEATLLIS